MSTKDLKHKIKTSCKEKLQYALLKTMQDNPSLIEKIDHYAMEYQNTLPPPPPIKHQQDKPNGHNNKYISRRNRFDLTVSWFIRDVQKLLIYHNKHIPSEIKEICLSFYYIPPPQLPETTIDEREFYKKWWIEASKYGETGWRPVRKICLKSDKNKKFALKLIKKKGRAKPDMERLKIEMKVLYQCNHENIPKLVEHLDTKKRMYCVLDYVHDANTIIDQAIKTDHFNEKSVIDIVRQIASALDHLHGLGYVHSDVKPDNLRYYNDNKIIKLIDFESCGDCNDGLFISHPYGPFGTLHYAAPEMLNREQIYNQSVDMWSLGIIIYILLYGYPPFYNELNGIVKLVEDIKAVQFEFNTENSNIDHKAKDLVRKLLVKDPYKRLSAWQVLNHPWIVNENEDKITNDFGQDYIKQLKHWRSIEQRVGMSVSDTIMHLDGDNYIKPFLHPLKLWL